MIIHMCMQLLDAIKIVMTHAHKFRSEQPHAHRHLCPHAHVHVQTHVVALPLSPICMLFLLMSQVRVCIQITINLFLPGYWST